VGVLRKQIKEILSNENENSEVELLKKQINKIKIETQVLKVDLTERTVSLE
jgi:hypothetical protein